MTATLQDTLGELTGEELFNLLVRAADAQASAAVVFSLTPAKDSESGPRQELLADLIDVFATVAAQAARITIPLREAASIVYRTRYARGHPVRVPGT